MIDLRKIEKVLITRFSSLGDILLTTPLVRTLKQKYPHLKIDFLLKPQYRQVYEFNPYINSLLFFENDREREIRDELKKGKYDLVVDLQNNIRSRRILKNVGSVRRIFKKPTFKKFLLVKFKINKFKEIIPIPQYYARSIENFRLDENGLDLFMPENIEPVLAHDGNYIGLCPGSRHYTKMWPKEYFVELGNMLEARGFTVVLFGGKDDKETVAGISQHIKNSIDLSNNDNLLETAVNMKRCRLVICNDSGLMHTASAVKVPIIAIFGSTVKEFGFFPYKAKSLILENNLLNCRPCSHIGRSSCPEKHFKCMLEISPQIVFDNVLRFLPE